MLNGTNEINLPRSVPGWWYFIGKFLIQMEFIFLGNLILSTANVDEERNDPGDTDDTHEVNVGNTDLADGGSMETGRLIEVGEADHHGAVQAEQSEHTGIFLLMITFKLMISFKSNVIKQLVTGFLVISSYVLIC